MGRPFKKTAIEMPTELATNETPTFKESKGSEANQHAKAIAKAKSKKEKVPSHTFYTQRGSKVLKITATPGKTHSIYVGNLTAKKNKVQLEPLIVGWKKEGSWLHEHEVKEKMNEIQEAFKK